MLSQKQQSNFLLTFYAPRTKTIPPSIFLDYHYNNCLKIHLGLFNKLMKKASKLKFVKRANMWCVTYWDGDKIKQKWFSKHEKTKAKDFMIN